MKKRGVTNIEMIVAIVLFVLAVFSMLIMFNIYKKPSVSSSNTLDLFEQKFLSQAQTYKEVDVNVSSTSGSSSCFDIPLNENLENANQNNVTVYYDNSQVNFDITGGSLSILGMSGIYRIYLFNFAVPSSSFSGTCDTADYNYTIPTTGKIFSYDSLDGMNSTYYSDYNSLRNMYGRDFNLIISNVNGPVLFEMKRTKPVNSEVFARDMMIKVYENKTGIINAVAHVEVW